MRLVVALGLLFVLAGCSDDPAPASGKPAAASKAAHVAGGRCPVTLPDSVVRTSGGEFNYGDPSLATWVWPRGRLLAGPRSDGSISAEIAADGSIEAKVGWWRGVEGRLAIAGERLDAAAPPLRAFIPDGYGPTASRRPA